MQNIMIFGGTGFVGAALCDTLIKRSGAAGLRVVVPTRSRATAKHLFPLPNVDVIEANVHDDTALSSLAESLGPEDVVVNLIAILHGTAEDFQRVHARLPARMTDALRRAGVRRFIHVSALGVSEQAPSAYLRSKFAGERAVQASALEWTLLRPSVIFGEHDRFLNLFARLQAIMPLMPLAGAHARMQPVWVGDVAQAIVRCVFDPATARHTYECAGPEVYTLKQLVQLAGELSGHRRWVLPVPELVGRLQAALLAVLPGEPTLSADNLKSLRVPNVASGVLDGLGALGLSAHALRPIAVNYLRKKQAGEPQRYNELRRSAHR